MTNCVEIITKCIPRNDEKRVTQKVISDHKSLKGASKNFSWESEFSLQGLCNKQTLFE